MITSNEIFQAEEEFRKYHDKLREELDEADGHLSVVKDISDVSNTYLQELNQTPGFWELTLNAHISSTLMHVNNLFGKGAEDKHLHMHSFLGFTKKHPEIFTKEAFERRLRTAGRYDELAEEFDPQMTVAMVELDIETLNNLPISGLKAWRNRILSHIDKNDIAQGIKIDKKYPVKLKHIVETIETLDKILNKYSTAFDFSEHLIGLPVKGEVKYLVEAIKLKETREEV